MTIIKATDARSSLHSLIDEAAETHQPITNTGKRHNAVLVSESDWNAINARIGDTHKTRTTVVVDD